MQFYDPITGVTTEAYVAALTLDHSMGAAFLIRNTHATATMHYKVTIYLANGDSALPHEFISETNLDAETTSAPIIITYLFAKAVVSVKQNAGGAGTYQLDPALY